MIARYEAVRSSTRKPVREIERECDALGKALPVSEYFGRRTFGLDQMKEKLSSSSFESLMSVVKKGSRLDDKASEEIAGVIKDWAGANGVTHFCHWFQPMTGLTAEKHDALISSRTSDLGQTQVFEKFSGTALIQSEPDASSFPSGGMRTTFEARGYTAWDPTSPMFIMDTVNGGTICIPSAFISYRSEALDFKTPLIRSMTAINREGTRFLKLLGDVDVKEVTSTLGVEQEYVLIDRDFYSLRPDLIMTGRTLLGRAPTKGQQFEDHYFGSIPPRALAFMQELDQELYKLGVPLKTRHNEVAPAQFEVAPIFETASVSSDHNCLLMDMIPKIAARHGFKALLSEKPFAEVNGSGKHNNWALSTNRGDNLLDPGKTPHQSLRFLAVLAAVLKAVHDRAGVLRAAIASPGNDHRLGANEAPPAIVSVFLGDMLTSILDRIEKGEVITDSPAEAVINLGVQNLPTIAKDNTDRNRTSPFAFTGNKFEFRAVGSSTNVAVPTSYLNAAVAQSFSELSERLSAKIEGGAKRDLAALELIKEVIGETKAIRFEGNNYGEEWVKEAKKRGLPNLKNSAEALKVLDDEAATSFLQEQGVLSRDEVKSRYNVAIERYNKQLDLEAATLIEMVDTYVLPAVKKEMFTRSQLVESFGAIQWSSKSKEVMMGRLEAMDADFSGMIEKRVELEKELESVRSKEDEAQMSELYATKIFSMMQELRTYADRLEGQVSDEYWTLPKYREMLFLR